jgi:hypothetical protein
MSRNLVNCICLSDIMLCMSQGQETVAPEIAVLREEQWRGELRLNYLRAVALIALYAQHWAAVHVWKDPTFTAQFDRAVSAICAAWCLAILGAFYCLWRRWLPPYLKYGTSLWDLAMCSAVISLGDGPRSGLLVLLPVVVAASAVRISRALVWFTTIGAVLCYLIILGRYAWVQVGFDRYYATPELRIPRTQELIMVITLLVAGLLAGQSVRQVRRILGIRGNQA